MVWQRARSDDQKEQRRTVLLAAAARLYDAHGIEEVSLNAIAREANISKANVYRYFESREELFLHLTLEAALSWIDAMLTRLRRIDVGDQRAVAQAFVSTIVAHPRFARLSSVLSTVIERNVSTDVIVWFKQSYLGSLGALSTALAEVVPELTPDRSQDFLELAYFLLVGMWPAAHPAAAVQEALQRPELKHACVDFETRFEHAIITLLRGLCRARE